MAVNDVVLEVAVVLTPIGPLELALSVLKPLEIVPAVLRLIWPDFDT